MADTPFPIPRQLRQTDILVGDGVNATYGPFDFKIFDVEDVTVYARPQGERTFTVAFATVAKMSNLPLDFFTITFPAALSTTTEFVVGGDRLHERTAGITKGVQLDPTALEKELSKQGVILQELRRDVALAIKVPYGETAGALLSADPGDFLIFDEDGNIRGSDPPSGAGNMNTAVYDPGSIGGDAFDRKNWGDFDSQAQFAAKNIPAAIMRVSVGTGLGRHDKIRIAAPGTVRPWHSQSADGAWWEIVGPSVRMDVIAAIGTGAANQITLDGAIKYASEKKVPLEVLGDWNIDGVVETRSGLLMDFKHGSVLRQTKRSVTGAFVTNVTTVAADRVQTDIDIINPQIDGNSYPDPIILEVASATTNTITFTAAASAVDDAYTGLMFQCMDGALANATGTGTITDYVGSTRTATLAAALPSAPAAGVDVQLGYNDNGIGFAWGGERINIVRGHIRGYKHAKSTPPVLGSKGANLEQGVDDATIIGTRFTDCGTAVFLSGKDGDHTTGASKRVVGVRVSGIHAKRCGSMLTLMNLDSAAGIANVGDELEAVIENSTYHNCGHAGLRIVGTAQEKCGIINLGGANGVTVHNIRGHNDTDVVTQLGGYPTDYAARVGFGLSGPPGALLWGHCRNSSFSDLHHWGDLDAAVHLGRARAFGDDAPPGLVTELIGWNIRNLNVHGTLARIVSRDESLGFDSSQIQGFWELIVDTVTDVFVPPQFTAAAGLILDIKRRSDGTQIIGTAKDILARGNTFADYIIGEKTDLRLADRRRITLADDTVYSFVPLRNHGTLKLAGSPGVGGASLNNGSVTLGIFGGAVAVKDYGTNVSVGTTALTNGTADGVDGNWNVHSVVSDKIYIKNRTGGTRTIDIILE